MAGGRGRERRTAARYPIRLSVSYRLIQRNLVVDDGPARTANISSNGMLILADRTFPLGALLELLVEWPYLRDGVQPIQLRLTGRVVRSDTQGTAVRALSHDSYVFSPKRTSVGEPSREGGAG